MNGGYFILDLGGADAPYQSQLTINKDGIFNKISNALRYKKPILVQNLKLGGDYSIVFYATAAQSTSNIHLYTLTTSNRTLDIQILNDDRIIILWGGLR